MITPTIGRPVSLERLLTSLTVQTHRVSEVVIADGSTGPAIAQMLAGQRWAKNGLVLKRVLVTPPHAVRQREAAIAASSGNFLLLLDDDVELEPTCVAEMVNALREKPEAVAVMADFNNQSWSQPTRAWKIYLRLVHGIRHSQWQGRVVGPLLRFGFDPRPSDTVQCDWIGSGNSLIRREAFERAGGFSDFFLHRSTVNEDVDLSLRLARQGPLLFCPHARLGHFHDPEGRVTPRQAAEDDVYNRFHVLSRSAGRTRVSALGSVLVFVFIESLSNFVGVIKRRRWRDEGNLLLGRLSGLCRIFCGTRHARVSIEKLS